MKKTLLALAALTTFSGAAFAHHEAALIQANLPMTLAMAVISGAIVCAAFALRNR